MDLIILQDSFGCFMNVSGNFLRLEGFSKLLVNPGGEFYKRRYIDSYSDAIDITSTSTKITYVFDRMSKNAVHDVLSCMADMGKCGNDCEAEIVSVDFSREKDGKFYATKQKFAVLCLDKRPENGFLDYSGEMIACGKPLYGYALLSEDKKSVEFTPERRGILCD